MCSLSSSNSSDFRLVGLGHRTPSGLTRPGQGFLPSYRAPCLAAGRWPGPGSARPGAAGSGGSWLCRGWGGKGNTVRPLAAFHGQPHHCSPVCACLQGAPDHNYSWTKGAVIESAVDAGVCSLPRNPSCQAKELGCHPRQQEFEAVGDLIRSGFQKTLPMEDCLEAVSRRQRDSKGCPRPSSGLGWGEVEN